MDWSSRQPRRSDHANTRPSSPRALSATSSLSSAGDRLSRHLCSGPAARCRTLVDEMLTALERRDTRGEHEAAVSGSLRRPGASRTDGSAHSALARLVAPNADSNRAYRLRALTGCSERRNARALRIFARAAAGPNVGQRGSSARSDVNGCRPPARASIQGPLVARDLQVVEFEDNWIGERDRRDSTISGNEDPCRIAPVDGIDSQVERSPATNVVVHRSRREQRQRDLGQVLFESLRRQHRHPHSVGPQCKSAPCSGA